MAEFDLLIHNGSIYTMEHEGEQFSAMAVKNGRVVALFKELPADAMQKSKRTLDLKGRAVLPGLIDSHFHFMATAALREMALNISEIEGDRLEPHELAGVRTKLLAFAEKQPKNLPVLCFNYVIASILEDRLPNRSELDVWLPGRSVLFISMDGHSSALSTEAFRSMGLDPAGHSGIFSGAEHDLNMGRINDLVMKHLSLPLLVSGVQKVVNDALSYGLTAIHCLEGFEDSEKDTALWFLSTFGGSLPVDLRLFIQYKDPERVRKYVKKLSYARMGGCGAWEMDGSIGSRTAAFDEPYASDPDNTGKLYYSPEEVERYVGEAQEKGFQVTSHAIGTRAIETLLSAYERVMEKSVTRDHQNRASSDTGRNLARSGTNPLRHRIDHFEFPTQAQADRAMQLGIVITAQPGYSWMDETFQKAYRKYLTEEQYQRQIPLRTIVEQGGILCGSSDSPIQHLDPFQQIHGMVHFPIAQERLTVYQAFRTYTWNGAYAMREEADRGSLVVGKRADFIVLAEDPFRVPASRLLELKVQETYIKGRKAEPMKGGVLRFLLRGLLRSNSKL